MSIVSGIANAAASLLGGSQDGPSAEEMKAIKDGAGGVLFGTIMGMQSVVKKNLDEAASQAK